MIKIPFFILFVIFNNSSCDTVPLSPESVIKSVKCEGNHFQCTNGLCIPSNWYCDSRIDCDDGSDEPESCLQNQQCRPNQFQCNLTRICLSKGWTCDEVPDCGIHPELGPDTSDEDPTLCPESDKCKWNEAACAEGLECIEIKKFCDGHSDCPSNSDEWAFCQNFSKSCDSLQCSFGCKPTPRGAKCYCPEGKKPDGNKCVDADECEWDESCSQICTNILGSFKCTCVSGYQSLGRDCIAINFPSSEPASLLFSTQSNIKRVTLDGKAFPGNSNLQVLNSNALEFIHRNHTICYIHHNLTKSQITFANVNNLYQKWYVPVLSALIDEETIQQIAFDWIADNWYFLDDHREIVYVCTYSLKWCRIILEYDLSKPRAFALDPTSGYMFFTKWGHSVPMLERSKLDGSERKSIVEEKIVYPYGVAVDYPKKYIYWVDTYLDYVEKVDYDGKHRKTVLRGAQVRNLHGITVFQNKLYLSSWYNNSILELDKFTHKIESLITNISRPYNVHIFHRQRQPDVAHPCKTAKTCDHLCLSLWNRDIAIKSCACASGYIINNNKCVVKIPSKFLLLSKSQPFSIKGIDIESGEEVIEPLTKIGRPKGLDYSVKKKVLFYADSNSMTIQMASLSNTSNSEVILKNVYCDGLAYDWISENLYWTSIENGSISVVKLSNTSIVKTLIQSNNFSPSSITVDPFRGIMYWADWSAIFPNKGRIDFAQMNGENRKVFLDENIHWPAGLAIDFVAKRLYWTDWHLKSIQSINFDGSDRTVETLDALKSAVGLAVVVNKHKQFYFIQMERNAILSHTNETGVKNIYEGNMSLSSQVKLYDEHSQIGTNKCSVSSCPELCFPISENETDCGCTNGFEFKNSTCVQQVNISIPSVCPPDTFQCAHKKHCIPKTYLCDGVDNCKDGSDESDQPGGPCENISCGENQVKCDKTCISKHWTCDGEKDCRDGTDEDPVECSKVCLSTQFKCKMSRRCIPMAWKCDNVNDCGYDDYSDEEDCKVSICDINEFTCKSGECIALGLYCDNIQDCTDGSDEVNCTVCEPGREIPCRTLNACLPRSLRCDGKMNCPDGSDERDCGPKIECEPDEFSCTNSDCIPKVFVCDADLDCVDGSDEMKCDPVKLKNATESKLPLVCNPPYLLCDNNTKCISPSNLCNNRQDCADGTDEIHKKCNDTDALWNGTNSSVKHPICEYPSRLCDNQTKCISVNELCDDRKDCQDGSDEGSRCTDMLCDHSFVCSHDCHNAPEGLICTCPPHLHLQADKTHCLQTHPCEAWGVCSQTCIKRGSRYKCTCLDGFEIQEDGFTCKSTDNGRPYVIFSNRHELRGVDLHTFNLKSFISSLKNTITLDFYHTNETDMVFWTDVIDDKIYRGTVVGGSLGNIEVVVQTGLSTAEGLAVDWIGENLYWVESNLDQIEVAKLNGSFRRTLIAGDMESPRAIAVDPRDGFLFWTDWDNQFPRIERCSMAGLNRQIIVKIGSNGWPNGLTLDYTMRRIYWIDARSDSIHTTDYHGNDHHEVMRNHEMLSHPFAITLFENYVYWTDWRTNSVVRANKWTGGDVRVIQRSLTQPFDIKIMHPSRQPVNGINPCGKSNGGCSHLCLLHLNHTYKCDCPHIMRLAEDNKTCVVNEKVMLISRNNEIRGVDILQPYYHTIPTISIPQVLSAIQLDYLARNSTLYWVDSHINEIKRSGLTQGPTETLIDTGLHRPTGLAVDWISFLLFVSSADGITVCNLDGEYTANLIENTNVVSVAVHPQQGLLYWISLKDNRTAIESSSMDGNNRKILVNNLKINTKSLTLDIGSSKLYWLSGFEIFYSNLDGKNIYKISIQDQIIVSAIAIYKNHLYFADDNDQTIHVSDKINGTNDSIIRNSTGGVLTLKIYDPSEQSGKHPCAINKGKCEHLCLPSSETNYTCKCAMGYFEDANNHFKCNRVEEFLLYSLNWELRGLSLDGNNETKVLGPISRVSSATAIDFFYDIDVIFWADSDHGSITKIKRDATERTFVFEQTEVLENTPVDWLTGLAIDWLSKNLYWCDSKRGTIVVSRLDGTKEHVLISYEIGKPNSIAVDPINGYLVWVGGSKVEIATLDGQNRKLLFSKGVSILDVTLDTDNKFIYFSDIGSNTIESLSYNGKNHSVLLSHSLLSPLALVFYENQIYWIDSSHFRGSIKVAPTSNMSDYRVLAQNLGDSLKDIQIFSKRRQNGTNPCVINNGGCEQLCLFNSTHPVCICSHGRLTADGKTCEAFENFVMYSRVVSIDSIQMMTDKNVQNSPQPSIKNNTMLKNAIGLSFSYKHKRLFYSDIQRGSINAVYFNGSDHRTIVERQGSVEGLAYEQVYNSLYWTCNNDATINRVNLTDQMTNASTIEPIVRMRIQDKPRGIAVDSCGSRVYWTNWNSHHPSVERAFLTGFGREAIIKTDIRMPNAITLDHKAQKLYWGDARLDKIERCEYDGTKRIVLAKVTPQHPFALAVYGDFIYWTDWLLHAVIRADKFTGQYVVLLRRDVARPMGIVTVANDTEDCFSNPCLIQNGFCEDICGLSAAGTVECSCDEGRVLSDQGLCRVKIVTNCSNDGDSFRCSDGGCVPFHLTCDGIAHCADKSDEEPGYCGYRTCPLGWFPCKNKMCIAANLTCNGLDDCGDSTDEIDCACPEHTHFRCGNGECLSLSHRCDYEPDCQDKSDEIGCVMPNCTKHGKGFVNCKHTTACLNREWFCDGDDDCWDNSDESNCTSTKSKCDIDQFGCSDGTCVSMSVRCDHVNDCNDMDSYGGISSDELNCRVGDQCRYDEFMCESDSACIPLSWHCNGSPDCQDQSDELNCSKRCRSDQFQCADGECIPKSWQCDGNPDCMDKSDENSHCQSTTCTSWEFRCNSTGRCIHIVWVCDGEADCQDGADEDAIQGCTFGSCNSDQFKCSDGRCIGEIYYCDGDKDCADGSDEENCSKNCDKGEFSCKNGTCIPETLKCNGVYDCEDNSDEEDCETEKATCKGLFVCANGICINETLLCNSENDCGDFSDENKCNINECTAMPPPCSQTCIDKPVGYECQCLKGFKVNSQSPSHCDDVDECLEKPCSQICTNTRGSYHCDCHENYVLHFDKKSCRANSTFKANILLANRYYIREIDLLGQSSALVHNLSNAVALDYDWADQCIYWSDVTQLGSSIKRLCDYKKNSSKIELLHSATLQNPDGLAVDWIGKNLYWCDKGLDTIEVSSLTGKYRKVIYSKDLEEPRAIALDPTKGYLYWSDWGPRVHIGKAGMDGSNAKVIIKSNLGWPNALTISYVTNELFWADAREDYIAMSDLDGNNVRIVMSREKNPNLQLHHVFSIDVWEDHIYWTDWETKRIERCNKYVAEDCKSITVTVHRPMDIRIIHPFRQPTVLVNPCLLANCSALCLLTPKSPFYTCACPENYILGKDGRSCESNCTSGHFECKSAYKCIPFWWKCDTQDDCGDGSDEPLDCPHFSCLPGQYQCKNKQCIHPSDLCNGKNDCGDNSDESDCQQYTCLNTQFRCDGNGTIPPRCISSKQRCNKHVDCPLGEDEDNCPPATCPPNQFKCANDKCIPSVWVCDKDNDCSDNSDEEQDCNSRTCGPQHFRCNSGRCIPQTWLCDGDPDCSENEDEPKNCSHPDYHSCDPSYFKCKNNKCIPGRWRCDYEGDCGDGSDEEDCHPRPCSESEFRCRNGKCIRGSLVCDGEFQCDDKSDEEGCKPHCNKNEFKCSNPEICIFLAWRCDGEIDCSDGSDEANCTETCPQNGFKCRNGFCISEQWRCDGQNDCEDGSDEENCFFTACPMGRFRCKNHRCVPVSALCDGYDQCSDGSDEDKHICKRYGLCPHNQFTCQNGHCISSKLRCDGANDCDDNSDEIECDTTGCKWDTCSQVCVESRKNEITCKCSEGYVRYNNETCEPIEKCCTELVIAAEAELKLISPKITDHEVNKTKILATAPGYKIDAVDILNGTSKVAFWTDHQNKRVQSMVVDVNQAGRSPSVARTIISNLQDPRGISVDWIAKRVYITDGNRILVSNLNGSQIYTLTTGNLNQPRDIIAVSSHGILFWADWGPSPRIETAYMDGYKRKVLVNSRIIWPTGLAVDYTTKRLYWADPKTLTIESILFDGTKRNIVKHFSGDTKPYKIDIFEDYLYVSTYRSHNLFRINKFGRGEKTYLSQGMTRISDLLIIHPNKLAKVNNTCDDFCNMSEFCLLTPKGASCVCPDGYIKDNLMCRSVTNKPKGCNLNCHEGTCKMQGQSPKCICPPQFSGPRCEHYRCSQYCKNHGICYVDTQSSKSSDTSPSLKCKCPAQWTGDRCQKAVDLCENRCHNDGNCTTLRVGLAQCQCKSGFTGLRCQNCENLACENGGVCTKRNNMEYCSCQSGYNGQYCENSVCGKYGKPVLSTFGWKCECQLGYSGEKCDNRNCDLECLNGGTCKVANKVIECICPQYFEGRRCERSLCNLPCKNGGKCLIVNKQSICKCQDDTWGNHCEKYLDIMNPCINLCQNEGICVLPSQENEPICYCTESWTGLNCTIPIACQNHCLNGGECSVRDGLAYCTCPQEYIGHQCEELAEHEVSKIKGESHTILVPILSAIAVIIIVLVIGFFAFDYFLKSRTFLHERLQENDFNNPIYQERDAEPFRLDPDKSGNFANPVYDSVFNGKSSGIKDEKAVLLQHSVDETPQPSSEDA